MNFLETNVPTSQSIVYLRIWFSWAFFFIACYLWWRLRGLLTGKTIIVVIFCGAYHWVTFTTEIDPASWIESCIVLDQQGSIIIDHSILVDLLAWNIFCLSFIKNLVAFARRVIPIRILLVNNVDARCKFTRVTAFLETNTYVFLLFFLLFGMFLYSVRLSQDLSA